MHQLLKKEYNILTKIKTPKTYLCTNIGVSVLKFEEKLLKKDGKIFCGM